MRMRGFFKDTETATHSSRTLKRRLTVYRYALDVNTERAEDVLVHKNLLQLAETPENRPAFHVRAVHVSVLIIS